MSYKYERDRYDYKVTWEQLTIVYIQEGGSKSFTWNTREKEGPGDNFLEDMCYAAEHGTVPNKRTGVGNNSG